jgi:hypothetical protein
MSNNSRKEELIEILNPRKHVKFNMTSGKMTQNGGTTWVTKLSIGTPAQTLSMMLDTGTLNTWVTDSSCDTEACKAHNSYNPAKSITYKVHDNKSKIESFGPWGDMRVIFGTDYCQLDSSTMTVPMEEFLFMQAIDYSGDSFKNLVADGGLAIPSTPDKEATALANKLYCQGFIDIPLVSFYYDKFFGYGECLMGWVNYECFHPETLNMLPLITPYGGKELEFLWAVALDSLTLDSKAVYGTKTQLVLDTGSSFFKGCADIITPLINAVTKGGTLPTTLKNPEELQNYSPMTITLGGINYILQPEQYFVKIDNKFVLGIQILEGMPEGMLLVGQVFLETVYSIFDFGFDKDGKQAIFLAEPIHKNLDLVGTWENEFGSILEIGTISKDGTFTGTYSSDTGATGVYPVMGVADPDPGTSQTVSFCVTWKSKEGEYDPSWHYVSSFTGVLQIVNGEQVINITMLLQKNISDDVPGYEATTVSSLTFKMKKSY